MIGIDLQNENVVTLAELAKSLPGRPCVRTLWRWATKGRLGVTLETAYLGGKRVSSMEAAQRFSDRLTAAVNAKTEDVGGQRQKQIASAARELDAANVTMSAVIPRNRPRQLRANSTPL